MRPPKILAYRLICPALLLLAGCPGLVADDARLTLPAEVRARCLTVLRDGLRSEEFWPAMHAAEGLSLAGYGPEVLEALKPRLPQESDDQRRCGLAREMARAGDRSAVPVLAGVLTGADPYGHMHAAESLFKISEFGDLNALRNFLGTEHRLPLRVMAAAALARNRDEDALNLLRQLLVSGETQAVHLSAWVLGQLGFQSDIPAMKSALATQTDPAARSNLQHALAILGDADGQRGLIENLSSTDDSIRTYAANFAGDARLFEASTRLQELLQDAILDVRIRAAHSLLLMSGPIRVSLTVAAEPVIQELNPGYCWFHPRIAAIPHAGDFGQPAVIMTIQKHLIASDHYSGLYFLRTNDLGRTWQGPVEIPELAWQQGAGNETIAVCDVTPGWLTRSRRLLAIGIRLRYDKEGRELLDQPRSHSCAYASFDPDTGKWTSWKVLDMPDENGRFYLVAPGCVQWLEKNDGTLLIPAYVRRPEGGVYTSTVLHCSVDGDRLTFLGSGSEMTIPTGRGLYEPSLIAHAGRYFLTLRSDDAAWIAVSEDGLTFDEPRKWTFDDGSDLGSYNTQAHWLHHRDGLILCYTRRGAGNDHIMRNRAPIFVAQVDPAERHVLRSTERILLPERGVMLGNFGAAAITPGESWVTDSEYIEGGRPHERGANGTTWLGRVRWTIPSAE